MREKLAELCHTQWSGWMEYLFSKCFAEIGQFDKDTGNLVIPKWAVDRWNRQMNAPYAELPENEKESDRNEADKFITLLSPDQEAQSELIKIAAGLLLRNQIPSDFVDDYSQKTYSASRVAGMMEPAHNQIKEYARKIRKVANEIADMEAENAKE